MKDDRVLTAIEQQNQYLKALIALQARGQGEPAEIILSAFGLGPQEIGVLVGKKPDAVRMLIKRHKQQKTI